MSYVYVLPPMNEYRTVPLHLFQTWHSLHLPPSMAKCVHDLRSANPEFTYHLYDDAMCRAFLQQHFEEDVVFAYDKLIPGAYKADLWRYCILYVMGGIYLDIKYSCVAPFKLIELTTKEHYVHDREYVGMDGIYQALLVCYPKNPILHSCIRKIVEYVQQNEYGKTCLFLGPHLIGSHFCKLELNQFPLDFKGTKITMHQRPILSIYPEYRRELSQFSSKKHYMDLWLQRNIYDYRVLTSCNTTSLSTTIQRFVSRKEYTCRIASACILEDKLMLQYTGGRTFNYSYAGTLTDMGTHYEKPRFYKHQQTSYFLGVVSTSSGQRMCSGTSPSDARIINPTFHKSTVSETLWCMATYNQLLCVIYSWYPLVIGTVDYSKYTLSIHHIDYQTPSFFKNLYTATNSVPWEDTQWVVLTKPVSYLLNQKKYIKYEYLFVVLNTRAEVVRYSEFFTVEENGYISDMQLHPEYIQLVYTTPHGKCCTSQYMWDSIHTMRWIHNSTL